MRLLGKSYSSNVCFDVVAVRELDEKDYLRIRNAVACVGCWLHDLGRVVFKTPTAFFEHVLDHAKAGHLVPIEDQAFRAGVKAMQEPAVYPARST